MVDVVGVFLLASGLVLAVWPAEVATLSEALDAVGSERSAFAAEPADWAVTLARVAGVVITLVGALIVVTTW